MNPAQALHTAARRYCTDQFNYWTDRYAELERRGAIRRKSEDGRELAQYTAEALTTFPRYNVLRAIGVDIERLDSEQLADGDETRELLVLAGATAEDLFTQQPLEKLEATAIAEEREKFCSFVRHLTDADLKAVLPLPYRRVLSEQDSHSIWSRLRERWHITGGYWYPLAECPLSEIASFQDHFFHEFATPEVLRAILRARKIERVWELREYGPEYHEDVALLEPYYNGAEGYWSSDSLDWIIYSSHESSVTVGGWLLMEIQAFWPQWQEKLWTSPFF